LLKQWHIYGMADMAHAMGANLKGTQKCLAKNKISVLHYLYFVPYSTIYCKALQHSAFLSL